MDEAYYKTRTLITDFKLWNSYNAKLIAEFFTTTLFSREYEEIDDMITRMIFEYLPARNDKISEFSRLTSAEVVVEANKALFKNKLDYLSGLADIRLDLLEEVDEAKN